MWRLAILKLQIMVGCNTLVPQILTGFILALLGEEEPLHLLAS
jgi:hypothetical protein